MAGKVRQAVVIVHGMGEQRPLDTLNRFVRAALPRSDAEQRDGKPGFYSRPERVTDSFESRRYLAVRWPPVSDPGPELRAQTEFYEYHWAHHMQGNRLADLWPTFRRMFLRWPTRVPSGLRVVWALFWLLVLTAAFGFWQGWFGTDGSQGGSLGGWVGALAGSGATAVVLTFLVRALPSKITKNFVDVVRYLDTSPRSYEVRRQIRKGMVDLLEKLHASGRYERIVVVAHSLGAYIAYDGIVYLWGRIGEQHADGATGVPDGLEELEQAASDLVTTPTAERLTAYQDAQRRLWLGLRAQGNRWLISDFVSVGTPMYFADQLYTRSRAEFQERVSRWEFPTCPPQSEGSHFNNIHHTRRWFSWNKSGARVLYYGAPFAVVRWTNMWFPPALGFFGDWFGGPLAELYGYGIADIPITGNRGKRLWPGFAHARYFSAPDDLAPGSATTHLREALNLASTAWLQPPAPATPAPPPKPARKRGQRRLGTSRQDET